jgi:adenosylcobinamide-GDP ribazoletransferase
MIRRLRTDLAVTVGFFTRLPVSALVPAEAPVDMARAVWAFPIVGALAGSCGAGAYAALSRIGLPPVLCACWSAAVMLLLTGALHEDGLADMADGFGGGRDAQRKLEIMRDSRIGSYGALALLLSVLVRIAAMAEIAAPMHVCAALIVSGALSRAAIVLVLLWLPPARRDGMASALHPIPPGPAAFALGLALALAAALLRGWTILAAPACALMAALIVAWLARRQIGGHTGDVLGACAVLADCAVLTGLSAR